MALKAKIPEQAVVNWEDEMAKQADVAAAQEANSGGGSFFSIRGGILAFNDAAVPNNRMGVIITDSILENVFYEGAYDPDNVTPPTCFAFGRDDETIAPHENVVAEGQAQHETCRGCPQNEWGTADKGKGKACGNRRRLGMIPAGTFDRDGRFEPFDDAESFKTATLGFMKLPVTSVKGYATFVKQVAGAMRRPPHGIFTKVSVVPDAKTQFRVVFEPIGPVPGEVMAAVMERHKETASVIEFPYSLEAPEPVAKSAAKANVKPAVVKKPTKKY